MEKSVGEKRPYTIEKVRPKKKEGKKEEEIRKRNDPMFAIFGDYEKILNVNKNNI